MRILNDPLKVCFSGMDNRIHAAEPRGLTPLEHEIGGEAGNDRNGDARLQRAEFVSEGFFKLCRRGTEDANADKTGPRQSAAAAQRQATWSSISRMRAERSCKDTGFWMSSTSRSTRP